MASINSSSSGTSEDVILMGQHCTFTGCNRLDFLPFQCNKCNGTFCIDHRREQDHKCPNNRIGNTEIPTCPKCGQFIKRAHYQSANDQVELHLMSGCKEHILTTNTKPKHNNRCTYKRCKQYELVPFVCSSCHKNYCIRHRLPIDHQCSHSSNNIQILAH